MPRHVLSLIAMTLAGCITTTRVWTVAPEQLPALAGMSTQDQREFVPLGQEKPTMVAGADEIRLHTSRGPAPLSGAPVEQGWANLDTLRWNPPRVTVTARPTEASEELAVPQSFRSGTRECQQGGCGEVVALSDVKSADIRVSRIDPLFTTLAIVGSMALLIGLIALTAVAIKNTPCTAPPGQACIL